MNGAGDELLSGPALAGDQDGDVRGSDALDEIDDDSHDRAPGDDTERFATHRRPAQRRDLDRLRLDLLCELAAEEREPARVLPLPARALGAVERDGGEIREIGQERDRVGVERPGAEPIVEVHGSGDLSHGSQRYGHDRAEGERVHARRSVEPLVGDCIDARDRQAPVDRTRGDRAREPRSVAGRGRPFVDPAHRADAKLAVRRSRDQETTLRTGEVDRGVEDLFLQPAHAALGGEPPRETGEPPPPRVRGPARPDVDWSDRERPLVCTDGAQSRPGVRGQRRRRPVEQRTRRTEVAACALAISDGIRGLRGEQLRPEPRLPRSRSLGVRARHRRRGDRFARSTFGERHTRARHRELRARENALDPERFGFVERRARCPRITHRREHQRAPRADDGARLVGRANRRGVRFLDMRPSASERALAQRDLGFEHGREA